MCPFLLPILVRFFKPQETKIKIFLTKK